MNKVIKLIGAAFGCILLIFVLNSSGLINLESVYNNVPIEELDLSNHREESGYIVCYENNDSVYVTQYIYTDRNGELTTFHSPNKNFGSKAKSNGLVIMEADLYFDMYGNIEYMIYYTDTRTPAYVMNDYFMDMGIIIEY